MLPGQLDGRDSVFRRVVRRAAVRDDFREAGFRATVALPRKPATSRGSTGMIIPSARISSTTVMKINTIAARRGAGAAEGSVMQ